MSWASFLLHPGAFTPAECDELDRLGRAVLERDGVEEAGIEGLADPGALRRNKVAWIPRGDDSEWAFARIESIAASSNRVWGLDAYGIVEDLQYTIYDTPRAHYTWHQDGLDDGVEDRKVSVVVQLSDPTDYAGAELEFLEVAADYDDSERTEYLEVAGARGTAVAFTAFEYHRVTPLVSGSRRSLVGWVSGPPLR